MRERLEAQQDGGERLIHLVVEVARDALALLLLGAELEPARSPALRLDAREQVGEGVREPLDLLHRLLGGLECRRVARVDRLDVADQLVQRAEAPLQHQDVQEQRAGSPSSRAARTRSRSSVILRSRLDAALAAKSAATTSSRFAATTWPLRDSRFFMVFRKFDARSG